MYEPDYISFIRMLVSLAAVASFSIWWVSFSNIMNDASSTSLLALSSILALAVTLSTLCQRVSWKEKRKGYSQLSLRRTPLGPALAVRLREMSVL